MVYKSMVVKVTWPRIMEQVPFSSDCCIKSYTAGLSREMSINSHT